MADGCAPIDAYGVIGDGPAAALVAADGPIDWLCLPDLSGPAIFAALLDPDRGGSFELRPRGDFTARQRYVPETTFTTADGVVRVTDALTLQEGRLLPWVELARRVEGVSGHVDADVRVRPRFDFRPSADALGLSGATRWPAVARRPCRW